LPLFSSSQVDTREIIDTDTFNQEEKWVYRRLGLPLYQFTAIFPSLSPGLASTGTGWHVTGQGTRARFVSFSFQNTKRASLNFLEYIFSHPESHGAPFEETISFSLQDPVRTDRLGSRVWRVPNQEREAI